MMTKHMFQDFYLTVMALRLNNTGTCHEGTSSRRALLHGSDLKVKVRQARIGAEEGWGWGSSSQLFFLKGCVIPARQGSFQACILLFLTQPLSIPTSKEEGE